MELLQKAHWPICRIADRVGFADPNYLAKVIKAQTGLAPREKQKRGL